MKFQKFPSFNKAIEYLETQGKPKYEGRIGNNAEICLYTLTKNGINHTVYVYLNGKVEYR